MYSLQEDITIWLGYEPVICYDRQRKGETKMHQIRITTFGLLILFVFTVSSLKVSFSYDQTVYQAQKRLNE